MADYIKDKNEKIFTTRHPLLLEKDSGLNSIWKLIHDSYLGGLTYRNGKYLSKHPKESEKNFSVRKERAVYFNQVSPIVDMLSGMLFLEKVSRKHPANLQYFTDRATKKKTIDSFMRLVSAYSLMFTCGVLIDSPSFDPEIVKTKADRSKNKIDPYSTLYLPFKIRDYYVEDDGELGWVLLDNSYYSHPDPTQDGKMITQYRLWTRDYYKDFIRNEEDGSVKESDEMNHSVGYVPFRFVTWRDDNEDYIAESIFEDIAYIGKLIYNSMSYMDEMLASGTFKMLVYPSADGTAPKPLTEGGMGPLGIIPFEKDSTHAPAFIGATLQDIDSFIKAVNFYMVEILKKIGASTDELKEFVKSGKAKKIDLEKMQALLVSGAQAMSDTEKWMYKTASRWEGKDDKVMSKYSTDWSQEKLQDEVETLTEMLIHPFSTLRKNVLKVLVKKVLANHLEPSIIDEINKEIDQKVTDNNPDIISNGNVSLASKIEKSTQQKNDQVPPIVEDRS